MPEGDNQVPEEAESENQKDNSNQISMGEFLESVSPSQLRSISDLTKVETGYQGRREFHLNTPDIKLVCDHDDCGGIRTFRFKQGSTDFYNKSILDTYIRYVCSNCGVTTKRFAIYAHRQTGELMGSSYKYGELPHFGPPTPTRLLRLLDNDREIFLRGRRCESQGLGIGAFTYYRRVVENRKGDIISEILKVAEAVSAPQEVVDQLKLARKEVSFSKAVETVKDAIPESLLINGHNPLTLLHTALSIGVHEQSDDHCLQLAHDVRIVLTDLADKVSSALKDEAELNQAVSRLMQATRKKKQSGK